jgi:hypothetical protein
MSTLLKSVWDAVFMAVVSLIIYMLLVKYLEVKDNISMTSFDTVKFNTVEVMFLLAVVLGSFADDLLKNQLNKLF